MITYLITRLWAASDIEPKTMWGAASRPFRAAMSFVFHVGLAVVLMGGVWITEQTFHFFWPINEPKLLEVVPVKWIFEGMEGGFLVSLALIGLVDIWKQLTR